MNIGNQWVTHLAWGSWRNERQFSSAWVNDKPSKTRSDFYLGEALLACCLADGSIRILRICQDLDVSPQRGVSPRVGELVVNVDTSLPAFSSFGSQLTALKWLNLSRNSREKVCPPEPQIICFIKSASRKPTLFCARPGRLHFLHLHLEQEQFPFQVKTLNIPLSSTLPGSSRFSPVTGLIRLGGGADQTILVSLLDGSIHVIKDACTDPDFDAEFEYRERESDGPESFEHERITTQRFSRLVRSVMMEAEVESSHFNDAGRISTMLSLGEADTMTIIWIHE